MSTKAFFIASLAQAGDDGLTLAEIIDSLPTDPGSIFAILLMAGFFGLIVYFGVIRAGEESGEDKNGHPQRKEDEEKPPEERAGRKGA